jgi:uncharacterized GH25 family protein
MAVIRLATLVHKTAATLAAAALLAAGVVVAGIPATRDAQAHDFWIEPSTFRPVPGATVTVGLRVGQNFVGDPVPRFSRSIAQFIVRQGGAEAPIVGSENVDPAGFFRADGQSTAVIAYRSLPSFVELPADKFEEYLRLEGLERIIEIRAERGASAKPGRERFSRYAKALLTGERPSAAAMHPSGFAYEIVPDEDPTVRSSVFRGRVLHAGKPLAGALVVAVLRSDPSVRLAMRSDTWGAFAFTLPRPGVWLIKSVHVVPASPFSDVDGAGLWGSLFSDADWASLWASLTFESPQASLSSDAVSPR